MNLCPKCKTENLDDIDFGTLDLPRCVCKCGHDFSSVRSLLKIIRNAKSKKLKIKLCPECNTELRQVHDGFWIHSKRTKACKIYSIDYGGDGYNQSYMR